jgi:hypothetical protein
MGDVSDICFNADLGVLICQVHGAAMRLGATNLGNQAVASFYRVAILVTNLYTCTTGQSQSSIRFVCPPPTVEQYLMIEP